MKFDLALAKKTYDKMARDLPRVRKALDRPLTYAEKVLFAHLEDAGAQEFDRGNAELSLFVDRVAMQDATAQMAVLQFMTAGMARTAAPTSVHCDHLVVARRGATADVESAGVENAEVYEFLRSAASRYGMGFWGPGAGIIHQVVLEKYAFPGGLMIGTDSHTPNAGGLGMIAIGVGGADAVDAMVGMPWTVTHPRLIGIRLKGRLSGWTSPKDVILKVAEILTVKGGTGKVIEYFGPGVESLSATGKATITNMGAEVGATCSIFPVDARTLTYLRATGRGELASMIEARPEDFQADREVAEDPVRFFDELHEIDLDTLEPQICGPHTPDLVRPVARLGVEAREKGYPLNMTAALIGSCTNSSYEDLYRAAAIAKQATEAGLKPKAELLISPGSAQILRTIERDGLVEIFTRAGATVLANACGPCIGQWQRQGMAEGTPNSIITTYNRNFKKRNDGNSGTSAFIASPEIAMAFAYAGTLDFDPARSALEGGLRFAPPSGPEIPEKGFIEDETGFIAPAADAGNVTVEVKPGSERLALLESFAAWRLPEDFVGLAILIKVTGKCTTDHISPAGPWLRFRGHLDRISENMLLGAVNAFTHETGKTGGKTPAARARELKAARRGWVVIGDENYGEGSSREHAAMEPRHLGCRAVIARSFARIHETNLKKQGLLPLWFVNAADYERIRPDDALALRGVEKMAPGVELTVELRHADGAIETFPVRHTFTELQVAWFRAGSALNAISAR